MDLRGIIVLGLFLWQRFEISMASNNAVFRVEHKFRGGERTLRKLRAHDARRHGRMLASVDLSLGGDGQPSDAGLYFTKVQIGNPAKDYHVQVDTGSDILWVNCAGCDNCPKKSGLGIKLNLYDPQSSSTSNLVTCNDKQCVMIYQGILSGCQADMLCQYDVTYGDGSKTSGYFIEDTFHYDQVSGNLQVASGNASIVFGCGAKQTGQLSSSDEALDGIIGFGQANSSVLSQIAAAGKVKKMFSHCLDSANGGGIFAIGQLVEPKLNSTPLIPNQAHYNIVMKSVEVAGDVLELSTDSSGSDRGAIIDSGTTLAYLPDDVYNVIMTKVIEIPLPLSPSEPSSSDSLGLIHYDPQGHSGVLDKLFSVDDGFPNIVFNFQNSLSMTIYPHDYLFPLGSGDGKWCIGLMSSGLQSRDGQDVTILGDIVLSNKLVLYDLVNQAIGWTEYNCSSSIKVKDEESGAVYTVGAHDLSSANSLILGRNLLFFFVLVNLLFTIHH